MMKHTARTRHFYIACLAARLAAFTFLVVYALSNPQGFSADLDAEMFHVTPLTLVWLLLMLSMLFRFFPSQTESLGCQKEFAHRMSPSGTAPTHEEVRKANKCALWVLLSWLALNGCFYLGHWLGWLNDRFIGLPLSSCGTSPPKSAPLWLPGRPSRKTALNNR